MKSIRMAIWLAIPILMVPLMVPQVVVAQSSSIYSWTDENGVKHFSDRAPANIEVSSQEIIPISPTDISSDEGDPEDTLNNEPIEELSYADQQRKEMADRREAEKKKRVEREQFCLQARNQLARIEPSSRVFYTDEAGNTARLDDDERVRMVEEAQNQIAEFCD